MSPILPAEVAWYVTGRFYVAADGSIQDVGYFLHLQGVTGGLFEGEPGESTALITFASTPFQSVSLTNGDLTLGLDTVGEFSLYLNDRPSATFEDAESFSTGERIARFRRKSIVVGTTVGGQPGDPAIVSLNQFSAALLWSREFELDGRSYDLKRLLPHGVTQWGTASTTSVLPPAGFTSVIPFVGTAIAIGDGKA